MGNPDRIRIWTNLWAWVVHLWSMVRSSWRLYFEPLNLKWWFKSGDYIMERVNGSNNAGDFKFRLNMVVIWFMLWAAIIVIVPDRYEFFPLLVVLWSAYVFTRD